MPPDEKKRVSRRRRLGIAAGFWGVLFAGSAVFLAVSDRQVSSGLASVEARASNLTVSDDDLLAAMFRSDPADATRLADELGIDPSELEVAGPGDGNPACLAVHVRRLGREGRVSFRVESNGRLRKVASCKA